MSFSAPNSSSCIIIDHSEAGKTEDGAECPQESQQRRRLVRSYPRRYWSTRITNVYLCHRLAMSAVLTMLTCFTCRARAPSTARPASPDSTNRQLRLHDTAPGSSPKQSDRRSAALPARSNGGFLGAVFARHSESTEIHLSRKKTRSASMFLRSLASLSCLRFVVCCDHASVGHHSKSSASSILTGKCATLSRWGSTWRLKTVPKTRRRTWPSSLKRVQSFIDSPQGGRPLRRPLESPNCMCKDANEDCKPISSLTNDSLDLFLREAPFDGDRRRPRSREHT